MRSRTVREGSVGLLILLGLALFGGLILWLRGFNPGNRTFKATVDFANVAGMQTGATVRYRGVNVGTITAIAPGPNGVAVTIELTPSDLVIPRDVLIEANQSGLIGETFIDMTPQKPLPEGTKIATPLDPRCNPNLIVCDKARLQGQIGVSVDELLRSTIRFASVYTDPAFVANLNAATRNTAIAAGELAQLSRSFSTLPASIKQQLNTLSATANSVAISANQTANKFGNTADQFGGTAVQLSRTAAQYSQLATSLNSLVVENRTSLVGTLNNFSQTGNQLRTTVNSLIPTLNRVNSGKLLQNLEILSANAAQASANATQASANLRDASARLNDPKTVLVLQQTLDSARATFQNTQKITSDLDDLTGDPAFRSNLKNLVNGLGKLVSSTEQLQEQIQMAQVLEPLSAQVNNAAIKSRPINIANQEAVKVYQPVVPDVQSIPVSGDSGRDRVVNPTQQQLQPQPQTSPTPAVEELPQSPTHPEIAK